MKISHIRLSTSCFQFTFTHSLDLPGHSSSLPTIRSSSLPVLPHFYLCQKHKLASLMTSFHDNKTNHQPLAQGSLVPDLIPDQCLPQHGVCYEQPTLNKNSPVINNNPVLS